MMRDGLLTLACAHGTTAHGCTLPMAVSTFQRWLRERAAAHRAAVGCRCAARALRIGGGA